MDAMLQNGVFAPRSSNFLGMTAGALASSGALSGLGASLVSGASSLIGGAMSRKAAKEYNKGQMELAQMNNQWNAEQAAINREWQEKMVGQQQKYDSASAQRQRLEQAGLNPYMMMSGGSAGSSASPSGGSQAAPAQMPNQQALQYDFSGVSEAINSYYQNRKLTEDTQSVKNLNQLGPLYYLAQMAGAVDGRFDWLSPEYRKSMMNAGAETAQLGLTGMRQQVQAVKAQIELTYADTAARLATGRGQTILNKWLDQQQQADYWIKISTLATMRDQRKLTNAQLETEVQKQIQMAAQTAGIQLDNAQKKAVLKSTIEAINQTNRYNAEYFRALQAYADALATNRADISNFERVLKEFESSKPYLRSRLWEKRFSNANSFRSLMPQPKISLGPLGTFGISY